MKYDQSIDMLHLFFRRKIKTINQIFKRKKKQKKIITID